MYGTSSPSITQLRSQRLNHCRRHKSSTDTSSYKGEPEPQARIYPSAQHHQHPTYNTTQSNTRLLSFLLVAIMARGNRHVTKSPVPQSSANANPRPTLVRLISLPSPSPSFSINSLTQLLLLYSLLALTSDLPAPPWLLRQLQTTGIP